MSAPQWTQQPSRNHKYCCPYANILSCRGYERLILLNNWSSTLFFLPILHPAQGGDLSRDKRKAQRETYWSRGTKNSRKSHITWFCTSGLYWRAATSSWERLSFAWTEPENRSPDAVKGLPSHDLICTPLEEVSPSQSQGTLAAKGKENFTASAPLGWLHRAAEDSSPQCSLLHISQEPTSHWSTYFRWADMSVTYSTTVCEGSEFLGTGNTRILASCFP